MINLIEKLCMLHGASGCEDAVHDYILSEAKSFADETITDPMGNLMIFRKGSNPNGKTLMLAAHMDEVGFIIKKITDDGMLKFGFVGGVDPRVVIGRRVLFGETKGVVGIKAVHLTTAGERKTMPKTSDLYIDIGATSKSSAENLVSVGDYGVFDSDFVKFGDKLVKSKAIDDRLGCAILLTLLKKQPKMDTWFCFTVQEEVGLRGAQIVSNRIRPDYALVVESTTAADLADVPKHKTVCNVRGGVVIPFMDGRTIYDEDMFNLLRDIAKKNDIPWQVKHMIAGGTDAGVIHKSGTGVKTGGIAAAVRYIHSASCVASIDDMENMLKIADLFLEEISYV